MKNIPHNNKPSNKTIAQVDEEMVQRYRSSEAGKGAIPFSPESNIGMDTSRDRVQRGPKSNSAIPFSAESNAHLNELFKTGILGGMLGGNMSRLLLRTRNQTLTECVDGLHGWVKKPKNKKQ